MNNDLPLKGLVVLEFAQFLAGPLCGLRLADLGAQVIKIERPGSGDLGRQIYLSDTDIGGTNTLFQAINRNKQSFAANLKDESDRKKIQRLLEKTDVVIQNFRPGVFDRLGFSYADLTAINPKVVYASVTGYGDTGPWVDLPGQDLLAQARSGVMWLNGFSGEAPRPVGLAVADMLAGHNLTQATLAALVRKGVTGKGSKVDTSLLEGLIDFQFEVLTTHFNDGGRLPQRASNYGAHAYLPAPYGVYPTQDGFIALAMAPLPRLFGLLDIQEPAYGLDENSAFTNRSEILDVLADRLKSKSTSHWLSCLQPADIWCAEVLDWHSLTQSDGFANIGITQQISLQNGDRIETTKVPFNIDELDLRSDVPAPQVGEHTQMLAQQFNI